MAKKTTLKHFRGTDHTFKFPMLNGDEDEAIDVTGWTFNFVVKLTPDGANIVEVANGDITISGTFDADPDVNTQRVNVPLVDTQTDSVEAGDYSWELKRTNEGAEAIVGYGTFKLLQTQHRT